MVKKKTFIVYSLHSNSIQFFSFVQSNIPFRCFVLIKFQTPRHYCSYIVRLLFSILILEIYSRNFTSVINNHQEINKHHTSTRVTYLNLSVWFLKAYCHHRCWLGFAEPFFPTGVEEGKTTVNPRHWLSRFFVWNIPFLLIFAPKAFFSYWPSKTMWTHPGSRWVKGPILRELRGVKTRLKAKGIEMLSYHKGLFSFLKGYHHEKSIKWVSIFPTFQSALSGWVVISWQIVFPMNQFMYFLLLGTAA